MRRNILAIAVGVMLAATTHPSLAEKKYGPGVTDSEIKLGQTMPYSGPASAFSTVGRIQHAYFEMINAHGGINGRKIKVISLDDGYSPPKTVEAVRRLVEEDNVLGMFQLLGTPPNIAVAKYLNAQKVPQLLSSTSSPLLDDPKTLPWTTIFYISQRIEANILASYVLQTNPKAKIGILYQNDDYGKGQVKFFKEVLGDKAASMIVKEASYDLTDPTIDSQIVSLQASGADTLFNASSPKFSAQAIRKIYDIGWKPTHLAIASASSIISVMKPAGVEKGIGVMSMQFLKLPDDPAWANDKAMSEYFAFMKQWAPNEPAADSTALIGYAAADVMVRILNKCGDNLTRENLLRQANSFTGEALPLLLPGILYTTTLEDHEPFREGRMHRFDGERWVGFGDVIKISPSM